MGRTGPTTIGNATYSQSTFISEGNFTEYFFEIETSDLNGHIIQSQTVNSVSRYLIGQRIFSSQVDAHASQKLALLEYISQVGAPRVHLRGRRAYTGYDVAMEESCLLVGVKGKANIPYPRLGCRMKEPQPW